MIRFSKGFGKDNTCKDKPLHGGIGTMCVFVCVCVCVWGREKEVVVGAIHLAW